MQPFNVYNVWHFTRKLQQRKMPFPVHRLDHQQRLFMAEAWLLSQACTHKVCEGSCWRRKNEDGRKHLYMVLVWRLQTPLNGENPPLTFVTVVAILDKISGWTSCAKPLNQKSFWQHRVNSKACLRSHGRDPWVSFFYSIVLDTLPLVRRVQTEVTT